MTAKNFNDQTLGEEISNAISHGVGTLFAIAATALMIIFASINHKSALTITAVSIYGATLILLYLTSCIYHALGLNKGKKVFQILDHCMIFVLIVGTYTPICLSIIGGVWGWTILSINIACAAVGIPLNAINMKKWSKPSLILYITMGWSILLGCLKGFTIIPLYGWLLILLAGVFYTVGIIFYKMKNVKYMHFIWHLFVLAGSIPLFIFVFHNLCLTA